MSLQGFRGADVVHFTNVYVPPPRRGPSFVLTIHDLDAITFPELYAKRYVVYTQHAFNLAVRRSTLILTDTEAVRAAVLDRYGISDKRVVVAGIGLSPSFVALADKLPLPRPVLPMILFAGTLTRKKNIAWMTRAVAEGVRRGALPPLRLLLAGNPGYGISEILEAITEARGIAEWVRNPDQLHLVQMYREASALILPSYCEGFGIPLLEAMYCGVPIVASNIPTSQEVAGGIAEFFDLGDRDGFYDAVRRALYDVRSEERRANAAKRLNSYSWPMLVPGYVAAYRASLQR
jgi:glycosyltransferase involved in cell wall biosynthesis